VDTVYSLGLGAAIAAAAVSLLARAGGFGKARTLALLSLGFLILSVTVHLAFGHRPGTEQALGVAPFVREHPAFAVVAAVSLALLLSFRRPSRA
jgi:hypothetical protein